MTLNQYLHQIKHVTDSLADVGHLIDDTDLIFHTLNSLPSEYDSFSTSIRGRDPLVTSGELHNLLLTEEIALDSRTKNIIQVANNLQAFNSQRTSEFHNNRGSSRTFYCGRGKSQFTSFNNGSTSTPTYGTNKAPPYFQ